MTQATVVPIQDVRQRLHCHRGCWRLWPSIFLQVHWVAHEPPHVAPHRVPYEPLASQRSRVLGSWVSTKTIGGDAGPLSIM
ncbi:hypothetical protein FF1_034845 [Malus domestica]